MIETTDLSTFTLSRRSLIAGGAAATLLPTGLLAADSKPITCSISLQDGRVWIAASIKGSKPMLFIVDTGAAFNMIRPEISAALKLPVANVRGSVGLGKNESQGEFVTAREFVLGGALRVPQVGFTNYDFGKDFHPDMAGILAAGLFTAYDTDIDFEHSQLRIWQQGRPNRDGLIVLPSNITRSDDFNISRKVVVNAVLDGRPYRLLCDTGAPGNVLLFANAAYASGVFSSNRPYAPQRTGGIGGRAAKLSRIVRMQSLQIGPIAIGHPLVEVMNPTVDDHMSDHDGLIGLDLLSAFLLSTDLRTNKLWVGRNNLPIRQPHYSLSGIWLERSRDGSTTTVTDVGAGSPAAVAGLRIGDIVLEPSGFTQAAHAVSGEDGKAVTLKVRRGSETRTISYTPKPWF